MYECSGKVTNSAGNSSKNRIFARTQARLIGEAAVFSHTAIFNVIGQFASVVDSHDAFLLSPDARALVSRTRSINDQIVASHNG
jgi:hypothetical protein